MPPAARRTLALALRVGIPCALLVGLLWGWSATGIRRFLPSPEIHAAIEWATVFPTLAVAYAAIASRRAGGGALALFLGLGFLSAAIVDLVHPFGTMGLVEPWFRPNRGAEMWTWTMGRLLCAALLVAGGAVRHGRLALGERPRVWLGVAATVLGTVAVVALIFSAPSRVLASEWALHLNALLDASTVLLFVAAFLLYERAYREGSRPMWRAAATALLVMSVAQLALFASREALDGPFFAAHLMKLGACTIAFAGLLRDHGFLAGRERELRRGLESERRRLQRVLDATGDGIIVVRRDDTIVLANPASCRLLGVSGGAQVVGKSMSDLLAGRLTDPLATLKVEFNHRFHVDEALQGRNGGGLIARSEAPAAATATAVIAIAKTRWIESRYAPMPRLPGDPVSSVVITLRDITALRDLAEARATADAMRSLLTERDEFLSIASHELNTPLTAAKVSLGSIIRRAERGLNPDVALIRKADKQLDRLASLVEDLLEVSRIQMERIELDRKRFDYLEVVTDLGRSLAEGERGADLRVEVPEGRLAVEGDRARLEQVLTSLVSNAFKYSPAGRPVDVLVRDLPDGIHTTVVDRGIGIPAEDLHGIFDRYRKARNVRSLHYGGFGLQLFIAAEIVERHGGRISVESREGMGTVFTFVLPRAGEVRVAGGRPVSAHAIPPVDALH